MRLYFLRHAHALDAVDNEPDQKRRLSAKGLRAVSHVAKLLSALEVTPAVVYTSPRVRALQTAEVVSAALGVDLQIRDEMDFGFDIAALKQLIDGHDVASELLFVGHEPTMSQVINEITGAHIQMKKSGIVRMDIHSFAPLKGDLIWLLPPKITKVLADA